MCVKSCDCNNCLKLKTCTDCIYQNEQSHKINCFTNGLQGCPHRVDKIKNERGYLICLQNLQIGERL